MALNKLKNICRLLSVFQISDFQLYLSSCEVILILSVFAKFLAEAKCNSHKDKKKHSNHPNQSHINYALGSIDRWYIIKHFL